MGADPDGVVRACENLAANAERKCKSSLEFDVETSARLVFCVLNSYDAALKPGHRLVVSSSGSNDGES